MGAAQEISTDLLTTPNFEHMPELKWEWGYPLVLGSMVAIAIAMLGFFIRKKWI